MRGLIAALYLVAVGWAISHYELDKVWAGAAHKALRGLMRENAEISLEVRLGQSAALERSPELGQHVIWLASNQHLATPPAVLPHG